MKEGWKRAVYTAGKDHFFEAGHARPICGSSSIFSTSKPRDLSRGFVCQSCKKRLDVDEVI